MEVLQQQIRQVLKVFMSVFSDMKKSANEFLFELQFQTGFLALLGNVQS